MDADKLKAILEAHRLWVCGESGGLCANLYGANLRAADLSYANLYGANLGDADLSDADLSDADLSYADLSGAIMFPGWKLTKEGSK
jgi:uncharacterized protein YjbI with pentapeptide repeats